MHGEYIKRILKPHRYHWSVEYFEDLRNVNHCEQIIMKRSENSGKYVLQNELRTWSALKRRAAENGTSTTPTTTSSRPTPVSAGQLNASPTIPVRRWGGCVNGCNHDKMNWPRRPMRKNTVDFLGAHKEQQLPPAASPLGPLDSEEEDHPVAAQEVHQAPIIEEPSPAKLSRKQSSKAIHSLELPPTPASPNDASNDSSSSELDMPNPILEGQQHAPLRTAAVARHLQPPSRTPGEGLSDDSDYFPGMRHLTQTNHRSKLRASSKQRQQSKDRKLTRRQTEQNWSEESGMGHGTRADTLGDGDATSDEPALVKAETATEKGGMEGPILKEARKGNMVVEHTEEAREKSDEESRVEKQIDVADVEKMQEADRKGLGEVY